MSMSQIMYYLFFNYDHVQATRRCSRRAEPSPARVSPPGRRRPRPPRLRFTRLVTGTSKFSRGLLRRPTRVRFLSLAVISSHPFHRCAPTIDLVLISHGDLAHAGLYAYAYARWGLKAPAYTTIPVQAMARIVTLEDIEGTRDEQDIPGEESPTSPSSPSPKYIATANQVHEAYTAVNTLRYSQPTHLQGQSWRALDPMYLLP